MLTYIKWKLQDSWKIHTDLCINILSHLTIIDAVKPNASDWSFILLFYLENASKCKAYNWNIASITEMSALHPPIKENLIMG